MLRRPRSRNNGFMNMLAVIKQKALQMELLTTGGGGGGEEAGAAAGAAAGATGEGAAAAKAPSEAAAEGGGGEEDVGTNGALYKAILAKARVLKPVSAELRELSVADDGRPVYELVVAAPCFEGLPDEKRQQLALTVLRKEADEASELVIVAQSPDEAGR